MVIENKAHIESPVWRRAAIVFFDACRFAVHAPIVAGVGVIVGDGALMLVEGGVSPEVGLALRIEAIGTGLIASGVMGALAIQGIRVSHRMGQEFRRMVTPSN